MATLLHPTGAVADVTLPAPFAPVEALVEHEQVLPVHPKLNAQAGQQLMRHAARGRARAATIGDLVDHYPAAILAPNDPVADNAGFVWNALLDQRAVDALALAGDIKALVGGRPALEAFSATLGVGGGANPGLVRHRRTLADLARRPRARRHDTRRKRLLGAEPARVQVRARRPRRRCVVRLHADEYTDGRLDWHTYTLGAAPNVPPGQSTSFTVHAQARAAADDRALRRHAG